MINAKNPNVRTPLWQQLLLGIGPRCCSPGCSCSSRDALRGGWEPVGRWARSASRRRAATNATSSGSRSRTSPASTRLTVSCSKWSISCAAPRSTRRLGVHDAAWRAAVRRRPARARHCWPVQLPARPRCRSSRLPHRSSSRRSSESAPAAYATCSARPRRRRPRSSSSTSSTRSAAHADRDHSAATTSASRPSTRSSPRWTASPAPKGSS